MKTHIKILSLSLIAAVVVLNGCSARNISKENKISVQNAMNTFIQKKMALRENKYDIEGIQTDFDYLHAGVKVKNGFYVSCADFKSGKDLFDIDYYVQNKNGSYEVIKEIFHKKNGEKINKILWKKSD